MTGISLYHNPRCSKSRQALELLRQRGVEPDLILYLEQALSPTELGDLLQRLGMTPRQLLRRSEDAYRELNLGAAELSDEELIEAMIEHPRLIERPIAVRGARAVVGRPPEQVLALLDD